MGIIATSVSYFCWVANTVSMCSQLLDKMVCTCGGKLFQENGLGGGGGFMGIYAMFLIIPTFLLLIHLH